MKAPTLETLIGLLAATGLRPGEAMGLKTSDVDLQSQVLIVRESKFGKSRQVPIHPTTVAALKRYAQERDRVVRNSGISFFFGLRPRHSFGSTQRAQMVLQNLKVMRLEKDVQRESMWTRSASTGPAAHLRHEAPGGMV